MTEGEGEPEKKKRKVPEALKAALAVPRHDPIAAAIADLKGETVAAEPDPETLDDNDSDLDLLYDLIDDIPRPGFAWNLRTDAGWLEIDPGKWTFSYVDPVTRLPRNCPVRALGYSGEGSWFLDPRGSLVLLSKNAGKGELDHLFAPCNDYLMWAWPQLKPILDVDKSVIGYSCDNYKAELARTALFKAAALKGKFDPLNKVRGRGVWRDREGGLIFHAGNRVLYKNAWRRPGEVDGHIYTSKEAIGRPAATPSVVDAVNAEMATTAQIILGALRTWAWERPDLDPLLALGFLVSCRICGALKTRPAMWISGGTGAGKSDLFKFLRFLMDGAMVGIEIPSAASIYQNLRDDCLAVLLDEQENSEDRRKMKAILDLVLVSFSGGTIGKGGQDGVPVNYTLRSSFLMSGIVQASMSTAAENRMVSLMLNVIPKEKATGFDYDEKVMKAASADLFGRALKSWDRLNATFDSVRRFLALKGYEGRHQDTYGTLIACAHVAMFDHTIEDAPQTPLAMGLSWWGDRLPAIQAKKSWHDLYAHILEAPIDAYRTTSHPTVESLIDMALHPKDTSLDSAEAYRAANAKLGILGLFVRETIERVDDDDGGTKTQARVELFVPNRHVGLAAWLRDTIWGGGSGETGAWQGVLKQIPPEVGRPHTSNKGIFSKTTVGVLIDLRAAAKAFG